MTRQTFVYRDDNYTQSAGERIRDAATALRITQKTKELFPERRARPRCTHTAENMMRMGYGDCPACVPRFASLEELRATAPDVDASEDA